MDFALVILALLSVGVLRGGNAVAPEKQVGGGPCESDDDCLGRGLLCYQKTCQCYQGWMWYANFCHLLRTPCSDKSPCDASKGLECSPKAKVCVCADSNHRYSPETRSCGLKDREPCYENGTLRHDLCASGVCVGEDTNMIDFAGRCSCPAENGVDTIFSGWSGSCKETSFGQPCNPDKWEHCDSSGTDPSNRMSCLQVDGSWVCACPEGRSYYAGFCVVADRSYGEDCIRFDAFEGVGSTCSLDPTKGLVCVSVDGRLIYFKCRCGKKALTSADGKVEYGSMTWNETSQRCELAPEKSGVGVVRRSISILIATLYLILI